MRKDFCHKINVVCIAGIALLTAGMCLAEDALRVPATEPEQAESTIKTLDGFRMKLIAAEPLTTDPVAMAYDENGVAYVAEMNDYPYTDKKNDIAWKDNTVDPPIGKIRMLMDTDGDGTFDKSYIFADELSWPTGVAPWKGGIFVAATPDIWYFKDTDGDHKADVKVKVFTGFRKYNVQAVMNNLTWGLDHQIYGSGSGNGGSITSLERTNDKPVVMTRHDFKFDPITKEFEALPGGGRFGLTFDDWGNRFICNIRNPAIHIVLPSKYLARNPYLTVRSAVHDVAKAGDTLPVYRLSPSEPWRVVRAQRWAGETNSKYPRSETIPDGYFTSASGITIYRGTAYPTQYYGNVFLGEVAGNLIHRELLKPDGVTFEARRAEQKTEFARSRDIWFRPVNFVNAPDGTLHVLDMYRETIEHPWSIPDDIKAQLDLVNGRDRGRIYRLEPPEFEVPRPPRLGEASTAELVATLENPNSWWRETAHRLIFERQDEAAVKPLRKLLRASKSPVARLHALYSLDGLGTLTDEDILRGLNDSSVGVREHAIRFAEPRLNKSVKLLSKVLRAAEDPEMRVRFQAAFTLGEVTSAGAATALFKIAKQDAGDEWVQAAVLSSAASHGTDLVRQSLKNPAFASSEAGRGFIRQLSFMVGVKNNSNEVKAVLAAMANDKVDAKVQQTIVLGLGDGLKRAGKNLMTIAGETSTPAGKVIADLLQESQKVALNAKGPLTQRKEAIQFLAQDNFENAENILSELIKPSQPKEIQIAAIGTLKSFTDKRVGEVLLQGWAGYTPFIRNEVVEAMLARAERLPLLLDAVEKGTVAVSYIPQARKTMLMNHANAKIKSRATELLGRTEESSRAEVVKRYQTALALKGDSGRGHQVYAANCASCHRTGREGADVGPNLATIHAWTPDQVLLNVLDPNKEISPNYVNYTVMLKNGETASGLIAEETPTSISLKRANNVQETILRQNIEAIASSGISLMPEGMESAISEQQMADLIAFLLGQ